MKRDKTTGRVMAGHATPAIERIMPRVVESDTPFNGSPCWIFTGAINGTGYGVVGRGRRGEGNVLTHRATYEHFVGPIPDSLEMDHLCRVRSCCNPAHVEPVDRHTNIMRGVGPVKTRQRQAAKTHCPAGHPYDEANTYIPPKGGGRACRACKREQSRRANLNNQRNAA